MSKREGVMRINKGYQVRKGVLRIWIDPTSILALILSLGVLVEIILNKAWAGIMIPVRRFRAEMGVVFGRINQEGILEVDLVEGEGNPEWILEIHKQVLSRGRNKKRMR